jgi:hypothetical protein
MTPAEQLANDVLQWSEYHPFVPDGTAGAYCGARSSAYQSKCGRRYSEEVHHYAMTLSQMASQEAGIQEGMNTAAPAFTFNPPPASEMPENATPPKPARLPYELRRPMLGSGMQARIRRETTHTVTDDRRIVTQRNGPEHYYRPCKRSTSSRNACPNEIEVYKVVTGTHTVPVSHEDSRIVEDSIFYWPDTAIVVETATSYSIAPLQLGFCSMKCLSLWAAKVARDTES